VVKCTILPFIAIATWKLNISPITTNTEAGWYLGLDDETVYRIDRGILEELASKMLYPVIVPRYMGVDRPLITGFIMLCF